MPLTKRQAQAIQNSTRRINLWYGSVSSGKTISSLVWWAAFICSRPVGEEFLMVGKTLTTLKRNVLVQLEELEPSFKYSISSKTATLYGHTIWLEGADNATAESKIRGLSIAGAYVDELTYIPKDFYIMLLSRLRRPNAKLIATTNPDTPTHYVYTDIIQNDKIDKHIEKFHLLDNTFLSNEYIEQVQNEYVGVYKRKYIDGDFVRAEGAVFAAFADDPTPHCIALDKMPLESILRIETGLDIGGNNSAHALTTTMETTDGNFYVLLAEKKEAAGTDTYDIENFVKAHLLKLKDLYKVAPSRINSDHVNAIVNAIDSRLASWGYGNVKCDCTYKPPLEDRPFVTSRLLAGRRLWFAHNMCSTLVDQLKSLVYAKDGLTVLDDGSMQIDCWDSFIYSMVADWNRLLD